MSRALVRVIAAGFLALFASAAALFFAGSMSNQKSENVAGPRLVTFASWADLYTEMNGDTSFVVALSHLRGLSEVPSAAKGSAVINFVDGTVTVNVQGLPDLAFGSAYEVLLVDNVPGPGNSVALDRGLEGDDVISLGGLKMQGSNGILEERVDLERLRDFDVDMVVVTRVTEGGREEFVVGGMTSLFFKMGRRASLLEEERSRSAISTHLWRSAHASGPGVISQIMPGLVEQGEALFFDETFDGNGRTCGTCHRAENNFALDPGFIATLPDDDPLFVAEFNPLLAELENPTLMRGPRGLIKENIDGFDKAPSFRAPPTIINLALTAPYGLSGEFATIADFSVGAVAQHFTKNIGGEPDLVNNISRVPNKDFRMPTQAEMDALVAFQESIFVPQRQDFDLDSFLTTDAQTRGRDLFFGGANCSQCHGGTLLSDASEALGGGNQAFNTGVANLPINSGDNSGFGPLPNEAGGTRKFSTPPLFNVKNAAPFFHDNSVATLREAVEFYDSVEFNQSPAANLVGNIDLTNAQADDIIAFLEALTSPQRVVDVRLFAPSTSVQLGDDFDVTILVEPTGQQVTGVEVLLNFDPQALQVVDADTGTAGIQVQEDTGTLNTVLANTVDNANGTVRYAAGSLSRPFPTADFTLATVSFRAAAPGVHDVSLSAVSPGATRADFGGDSVLDEAVGTQVTVNPAPAPDPPPDNPGGGGGGGGLSIAPEIGFRPVEGFQFEAVVGEENPEPQTLIIWTTRNSSVLRFNLSSEAPWIAVEEIEGISDSPGDKERIGVSVDISGLDAGTHTGTITISGKKARNGPQQIKVALNLEEGVPESIDDLVQRLEQLGLNEAVTVVEYAEPSRAAEIITALERGRAADILEHMGANVAETVLEELEGVALIEILRASEPNQLERPLSQMAPAIFAKLIRDTQAADVLLEKLPMVSAEQLLPVKIALADPDVPAPRAMATSPSTTLYDVAAVSTSGWTMLVGSPSPIENILAKFSQNTQDVQVQVEVLNEIPEELPALATGRIVNAAFSVDVKTAGGDQILVAQVTLGIDKAWVEANAVHRWSMEVHRYDKDVGMWSSWPARLVDEHSDKLIYVAAVPGFSTFVVTGMTELAEPDLIASSLRVMPPSGIEGQRMVVTVEVTNEGASDAVFGANLWIDDAVVDSQAVLVPSGQVAPLTFVLAESVGSHSVRIDRLVREFEVSPKFTLFGADLTPAATEAPVSEVAEVGDTGESTVAGGAAATPIESPTAVPTLTDTPVVTPRRPQPPQVEVTIGPSVPAGPLTPDETPGASEMEVGSGNEEPGGDTGLFVLIGAVVALAVTSVVVGLVLNRRGHKAL